MKIQMVLWHRTPIRHTLGGDRTPAAPASAGYTLLELVIVLAILGALAAVSMPALMRPWSRTHVQQAAQELSRDLLKARLDSIRHGTAYQFRWRENTGEYEIGAYELTTLQDGSLTNAQPFEDRSAPDPAAALRSTQTEPMPPSMADRGARRDQSNRSRLGQSTNESRHRRIHGHLANGVVFVPDELPASDQQIRQPLPALNGDPPARDPASGPIADGMRSQPMAIHRPWKEPIWFFPDGRTSTAELLLQDDEGYTIRLSLRGMTGTIRVGVTKKLELPNTINDRE